MARQRFDIGSKWLIQNQSKATLLVGGLAGVQRCEPMPGEVIQNRRYPDGLLRVFLEKDPMLHHVLLEIATYPERRALKQAMDDLTLAYSALGHLPELVMLVLRPKGKFRISGKHHIQSNLGLSRLEVEWRTVELWTLPAKEYLVDGDFGIMPWVPLMHFDGSPERVLERCAKRIEREAPAEKRTDLLVVSQVLASLRFPGLDLSTFFGGQKTVIESPFLQKVQAEASHKLILYVLKDRFGSTPRNVTIPLREIVDERKLQRLNVIASKCADLDAFREALVNLIEGPEPILAANLGKWRPHRHSSPANVSLRVMSILTSHKRNTLLFKNIPIYYHLSLFKDWQTVRMEDTPYCACSPIRAFGGVALARKSPRLCPGPRIEHREQGSS